METKTYEPYQDQVTSAAPGLHKLAGDWSANLIIDGALVPNGSMDFKAMNAQGVLTNGTHVHGTAQKSINANASLVTLPDGTETYAVVVQARDSSATYKGVLLRDENGEMTIVGVFKFAPGSGPIPGLPSPTSGQDEGTWVITKP